MEGEYKVKLSIDGKPLSSELSLPVAAAEHLIYTVSLPAPATVGTELRVRPTFCSPLIWL